jgi:hypothetical protein
MKKNEEFRAGAASPFAKAAAGKPRSEESAENLKHLRGKSV